MGAPSTGATTLEPPPSDEPPSPDAQERRIIEALQRATRGSVGVPLRIGDDAAVLANGMAWTMDTLIEGVHFDDRLSPADVGFKAVAVSVSDIAAMGGCPTVLLLGLSVRADGDTDFVEGVIEGVSEACAAFGVTLIGGDTTRSPGARMLVTTVGGDTHDGLLTRAGGRAGDLLVVTGSIGLAGAGWSRPAPSPESLQALRRPRPPVRFAGELARRGLSVCALDLSDGLATDLPRLTRASGTGATVHVEKLPVGTGCTLAEAVGGGEDYQLLFTIRPGDLDAVQALADAHQVRCTVIGALTDDPGVRLLPGGWPEPLFAHFGEAS